MRVIVSVAGIVVKTEKNFANLFNPFNLYALILFYIGVCVCQCLCVCVYMPDKAFVILRNILFCFLVILKIC